MYHYASRLICRKGGCFVHQEGCEERKVDKIYHLHSSSSTNVGSLVSLAGDQLDVGGEYSWPPIKRFALLKGPW